MKDPFKRALQGATGKAVTRLKELFTKKKRALLSCIGMSENTRVHPEHMLDDTIDNQEVQQAEAEGPQQQEVMQQEGELNEGEHELSQLAKLSLQPWAANGGPESSADDASVDNSASKEEAPAVSEGVEDSASLNFPAYSEPSSEIAAMSPSNHGCCSTPRILDFVAPRPTSMVVGGGLLAGVALSSISAPITPGKALKTSAVKTSAVDAKHADFVDVFILPVKADDPQSAREPGDRR